MGPTLRRFLLWLSSLVGPVSNPALAGAAETDGSVVRFAALLCSHCPAVTFVDALEVVTSVKVDVELPLGTRVVTANVLNVRNHPGADAQGSPLGNVTSQLKAGDEVELWCIRSDGWSFVVWGGEGGWCSGTHLKLVE